MLTSSVYTLHPYARRNADTHAYTFASMNPWVLPWKLQFGGGDGPLGVDVSG